MNQQSTWIFFNWLVQNNLENVLDQELLLEFISHNSTAISASKAYDSLLCKGLTNNLKPSIRKRSLYILSKILSPSVRDQWINFFTYYDSLYQTNKSILEPVLGNISNFDVFLALGIKVKWILVLWQRAFANEFASLKKMALEYFMQISFTASATATTVQQQDWIDFFAEVLFHELDTFFLYTEFDLVTLKCAFGKELAKFIAKILSSFPTFDLLARLAKVKTPSCIIYSLYGMNESKCSAGREVNLDAVMEIASNRGFYSTKLKTLLNSLLLQAVFAHSPQNVSEKLVGCICDLNVPSMNGESTLYLNKLKVKSEEFIPVYLQGRMKIETLKTLFHLLPPLEKIVFPLPLDSIKACVLLCSLEEHFVKCNEIEAFLTNYFLTCYSDDFEVQNLAFSQQLITLHLSSENAELRKKAFKVASTFLSIDLSEGEIDSIKKFSMKSTCNLKFAVLSKAKAEFTLTELLEILEDSHPNDAIHVLKCFATQKFCLEPLESLFSCISQMLAECETQLRVYFLLLEGYLLIVLRAELLLSFPEHFKQVFNHFLAHKKKGVSFVLGQKLEAVFRAYPHVVAEFTEEFVSFLAAGPFQESIEDKVNNSLCIRLALPFDFYGDSSLVNAVRLRASFNSLLSCLQDVDLIFKGCIERLYTEEFDCSLSIADAYPNTPKQMLKIRLLMSICLMSKKVSLLPKKWTLGKLFGLLQKEPLQSARYFIEFAMIGLCYFSESLNGECFSFLYDSLMGNLNEKPSTLISLLTVLLHVFPKLAIQHQKSLVSQIVCLFLNGNFMVRIYACFFYHRILQAFPELTEEERTLKALSHFIQQNEYAQRTIEKFNSIYMFNGFNPERDYTCQFIFHSLLALGDPRCMTEVIPAILFIDAGIPAFNESQSIRLSGWNEVNFSTDEPLEEAETFQKAPESTTSETIQRKIIPWELSNEQQPAPENATNLSKRPEGTIIVVASLLEKIPNIAGLCRTCEIFGASSLVLHSLATIESPTFKSIAVTSDLWLSLDECPKEKLKEFLNQKKAEGFQLVGLEQTSNSISLESYRPVDKTILILGNEKHGMPVEIINLMDKCVEIPQFGIIRSLNVHVSGSIILWEIRKHLSLLPPLAK